MCNRQTTCDPKGTFYNYVDSKEALAIAASDVSYPCFMALLVLEASTSPSRRLRQYFHAVSKELQRFEYRRGCLVGNFASEITNATSALKKRVAEHLDDATWRMSVVIEQGQKAGEIKTDIPPMDLARFLPASRSTPARRSPPVRACDTCVIRQPAWMDTITFGRSDRSRHRSPPCFDVSACCLVERSSDARVAVEAER